jgi:hypothetical protein
VDDAPYTDDLNVGVVTTREGLAELLKTVYVRADKPSLRALEAKTRHDPTRLSKTTVAEMLNGLRLPRRAVMLAFLRACGVEDVEPWRRAWERIADDHPPAQGSAPTEPADIAQLRQQVDRLTQANKLLRAQLADKAGHGPAELPAATISTGQDSHQSVLRESVWHFLDNSQITLVCSRLPPPHQSPLADPGYLNFVRFSGLADLDALIDIHGAIRANNPDSPVSIIAAQDLTHRDIASHLVLIGGLAWGTVNPWFSRIFSIPIEPGDPANRNAIVVQVPQSGEREFTHTIINDELVEDVGFFASGKNPSAPERSLTICGGITTHGVLGAARCFIDWEMRERNEKYLASRFTRGSTYCIVMRVPVANKDSLTPDLSKPEYRLFEWSEGSAEAT